MGEIGNDVKIRAARAHVPRVPIWDVEPLDRPVIAGGADLRLPRTATSREDHGPNRVEMAAQAKLELEIGVLTLWPKPIEREFMFRAPPAGH
jgi:hypothetical protein